MPVTSHPAFPRTAIEWLAPARADARVLVLGRATAPVLGGFTTDGLLVACDASRAGVRALLARAPQALPTVASPEHLPFAGGSFDAVFVHQSLHRLSADALAQVAAVMAPGGHLAVSYTVRDDSVPWVRRLTALLRDVDPGAMAGAYGTESVDRLIESELFATVEERHHRLWVPISRVDLLDMVARRFPDLDADRLGRLMGEVGALYESSARVPEPLLLPYQVSCWRAEVDPGRRPLPPQGTDGLAIRV
ncbi:class I SAM-dependent methyltransferase [Propioniciclava coleopterorum]|uniref:Class I SAM-dependent methyltransferase n=1 Tax=Propioniciclava coleopterorum TaxID=2714937 RepID=A0A6G7Y5A2_9ACTN|nr:class I SAM-dependent methyltransferase [Propioniciclava coleopterorum]QIK71818.1 class I SAM-dependent methyltransferase [Propioniciclava coleopterorum]